jgi:hypothetical protein
MRLIVFSIGLMGLGILAGCNPSTTKVHGVVKYKGKPLTHGAVVFFGNDNMTYPGDIRPDGTYVAVNVPQGEVLVVVQVPMPRPLSRPQPRMSGKDALGKAEAAADDKAKMSRLPSPPEGASDKILSFIPEKYGDPKQSELSVRLTQPDQEYNIDLP